MPGTDIRFAIIEDAADLLKMLPAPDAIAWPADPGDLEAVDLALRWMATNVPRVRASLRRHKRALREASGVRG